MLSSEPIDPNRRNGSFAHSAKEPFQTSPIAEGLPLDSRQGDRNGLLDIVGDVDERGIEL